MSRKIKFANGEFYHVYNRGVDKRIIFSNKNDLSRFFQSMKEFNVLEPIGSIYENSFKYDKKSDAIPIEKSKFNPKTKLGKTQSGTLVSFISYCLNPNHYHFILEQRVDRGIEKFMHRLSTGYTRYFNEKYKRTGALFQGRYKAIHLNSNEYLLHLSAYVNLNDKVHQLGGSTSKLVKSSWSEYTGENKNGKGFCKKDIILEQFRNKKEYLDFARSSLGDMVARKESIKEIADLLIET